MAEGDPKIARPEWTELTPNEYEDSIFWPYRRLLPADPDIRLGERSKLVGLVGVLISDLVYVQEDYPQLAPAVAYGDKDGDVLAAELPPDMDFGTHSKHLIHRFAAIELGSYAFRFSLGRWKPGHRFIELNRRSGGRESIEMFGVEDKTWLQQNQPDIPIVERLLDR